MSIVPTRRALVVDDSRATRLAAARLIEPYGFDVDLAEDGAAALRRLEERAAYDLVLVDLRMPSLDGHELLRMMRARSNFTPVVVMTAGLETRLVASTLRLGATDFLMKPLEAGPVKLALARALNLPPDMLRAETPRVLMGGPEECAAVLRSALPPYVEVDRVERPEVEKAVQERPYRLVVLDLRGTYATPDEAAAAEAAATAAAAAVLAVQPGAALCGVTSTGAPSPGFDVTVDLKGLGAVAEGSLYPNAVRPLVMHDEASVVVTGFRADPETETTYFAIADRRLRVAATLVAAAGTAKITVDLSRLPARSAAVERLAATAASATEGRVTETRLLVTPALLSAVTRLGLPVQVSVPDWKTGPRAVFRWTPDLAVGVEATDRQLEALFARASALVSSAESEREDAEIVESFGALVKVAAEHFADQEALMEEADYPELAEHRSQHQAFRSRLDVLAGELAAGGFSANFRQRLERDVCEWLYRHVQKTDRQLGQALARAPARPPAREA